MPEDGPVVVPPGADGERGAGVGLAALVARDHLHLARVAQPRPRDLEPPHPVVQQLVPAPLFVEAGFGNISIALRSAISSNYFVATNKYSQKYIFYLAIFNSL